MIATTKSVSRILAVLLGTGALSFWAPPIAAESESAKYAHPSRSSQKKDDSKPPSAKHETSLHKQHRADGSKLSKHRPSAQFIKDLRPAMQKYGLIVQVDTAFYYQYASRVVKESFEKNLATFSWRLYVDWRFYESKKLGSLFWDFTFLGSPGLNYQTKSQGSTRNIGSISEINGNIYPDSAALDEMFIKYVSPSAKYVFGVGKIDLSNRFDTNRVANDPFSQFFALSLGNNLSIPWPDYGGIGAFFRYNFNDDNYIMFAGANSVVNHGFQFGTEIGDQSWYQMGEVGLSFDIPFLGKGNYKLTPWHNRTPMGEGWGVGINFDQALYWKHLVSFFRFGIAEKDATPIDRFISFGFTWIRPFDRKNDMVGVGVSWSRPSVQQRSQTELLFEIFYRFAILSWLTVTPDVQVVYHPANNVVKNFIENEKPVIVPGIRISASF